MHHKTMLPVPRRPRQENQECKVTWQTQFYMTKIIKWNPQRNERATMYSPEVRKSYWDSCYWLAGNVLSISISRVLGLQVYSPVVHLSSGLIFHHFGISPFLPFPLCLYVRVCVCRTSVDSSRVKQLFAYPWLKTVSSSVGEGHTLCPSTQLQEGHIGAVREEGYIHLARLSESALTVNVLAEVTSYLCVVRHISKKY